MNKKGFSLGSWIETAGFVVLFMACIGIIIGGFNEDYNQNNNPTFGIVTNSTMSDLTGLQSTLQEGVKGEASTSSLTGVSLGTAWGMTLAVLTIGINIATGSWIQNAVGIMGFGTAGFYLGLILRLLFVASIILIILRLIFKINP
jgi:hypothetical protein